MSATLLFSFVIGYFMLLLIVAYFTSRNSNNESFFIGNRNSNWLLVAFGMIGTSLSGVTFVSVPGTVGSSGFGYFQVVIGYLFGYAVIAYILLPLYYKMNLTSIYNYLEHRFGIVSYKTGALFFIISRVLGATARLFLVINVMQIFILTKLGIPFSVTTAVILLMILLYTIEGGVKTIVFTDTLQTTFMLVGLIVCIIYILNSSGMQLSEAFNQMGKHNLLRMFNTDPDSPSYFLKHILGGAFIAIGMTGLDQEMMQKNISVKTLRDSQKNILTFSITMAVVNFLFLLLGGLLFLFAASNNVKVSPDDLFPTVALQFMPKVVSVIFIIGLISALFPSADGALTALTSSFCIDIIGLKRRTDLQESQKKKMRIVVHLVFAVIFFLMVMLFKWINNKSIIDVILKIAGFTYGPLLGLFGFGILTRRRINDRAALVVCLAAPLIILGIDFINNVEWYQNQWHLTGSVMDSFTAFSRKLFGNFKIGYELLIYNGLLTFLGLYLISQKTTGQTPA